MIGTVSVEGDGLFESAPSSTMQSSVDPDAVLEEDRTIDVFCAISTDSKLTIKRSWYGRTLSYISCYENGHAMHAWILRDTNPVLRKRQGVN